MSSSQHVLSLGKALQTSVRDVLGPSEEGLHSREQYVLPMSVVRNTRGYIEKVANQINGTFENGWYDASAVMIRRLLETLIIEAFEAHRIANKIKNHAGDFFYLRELIKLTLAELEWNLGRNVKAALPGLKDVGDKSAHSRRFVAHRKDIERLIPDLSVCVQELIYLAGLK